MKKSTLAVLALTLFVTTVKAQSCDPWITKAYKMLYQRAPSQAECNISNYNSGKGGSYVELVGHIASYNRYRTGKHLKGDPWIFMAYAELYNRAPMSLELNIIAYNNGKWGSYDELKRYIIQMQNNMRSNNIVMKEIVNCTGDRLVTIKFGNRMAFDVISNEEGKIIAKGDAAADAICKMMKSMDELAEVVSKSVTLQGFSFHDKSTKRVQSAGSTMVTTAGSGTIVFE